MDLEQTLKAVQIGFYLSASILAWLTYRSAKRGLLNTVNTEYKKRMMDRLASVSKSLWDDDAAGTHGSLYTDFLNDARERVSRIANLLEAGVASETRELRMMVDGPPEYTLYLHRLASGWETDPFIPTEIWRPICEFTRARAEVYREVSNDVLGKYFDELKSGRVVADQATAKRVYKAIAEEVFARGFGPGAVTDAHVRFRTIIQVYLSSFDPIASHDRRVLRRISRSLV